MKKIKNFVLKKVDLQIIIFVLLIPFIDIYDLVIGGKIELFNFSLIELFKIIVLSYLFIIVLLTKKDKIFKLIKRYKICFIIFVFLYVIWLGGHFYSVYFWDESLIYGAQKSLLVEFYYIVRTYGICLLLFIVLMISDISPKKIIEIISFISFVVCTIIVVSNVFKVGYIAYSSYLDAPKRIGGSVFNWLSSVTIYNADAFTTKGFFFSANQLSIVIFTSIIVSALYLITSKRRVLYVTFPIKLLAALMLSTKVCSLGVFLILILFIGGIIVYNLIKKSKINFFNVSYFAVLLILYFFLFRIAPVNYKLNIFVRDTSNSNIVADGIITSVKPSQDDELEDRMSVYELAIKENLNEEEEKVLVHEIIKYRAYLGIDPSFIEIYPPKDNIEFWKKMIVLPINHQTNFRLFKGYLYNDVIKNAHHYVANQLFGIGYVSNFPYMEQDFVGQKSWFGILGVLCLIGPYVGVFLISIWHFFKKFKDNFKEENIYMLIAISCAFFISILAGHLFGNLFPMSILILMLKCFWDLNLKGEDNEKKCN